MPGAAGRDEATMQGPPQPRSHTRRPGGHTAGTGARRPTHPATGAGVEGGRLSARTALAPEDRRDQPGAGVRSATRARREGAR
eukprot:11908914-Alexandrium_andersonii.AAC.1